MMQGWQWNGRRRHARFRRFRWDRLALVILSAALIVFGIVKLAGYGADYAASRQTADELKQAYQETTPEPMETPAPTASPVPPMPSPTVSQAAPASTPAPEPMLGAVSYPNNPSLKINNRFKALRKENKDIVGWLNLGTLLDEAVVQRDEEYYMTHDALGKKNVNGAIFLDSGISLKTRPYCYILYGHNMKTGAMFGNLRNYENLQFYHANPFISFDSMYEEGRYVIFAVGTINIAERVRNYVDLYLLLSSNIRDRQTAIDTLIKASVHSCTIDVQPDDQLLILVTCVDNVNERRVVAARRVREDETELKKIVERSWKHPTSR